MLEQGVTDPAFFRDAAGPERGGSHGEPFLEQRQQVGLDLGPAQKRNDGEPAFDSKEIKVAGQVGAADHVENDVGARVPGLLAHNGDKVFRPVVDPAFRSQIFAGARTGVAARRGEDPRPPRSRELDGGRADARRAAVHQKHFARAKPRSLEDVGPDREVRLGQARRIL